MRMKGRLSSWNDEKGYGFITPAGGGRQVFVHIRAFRNRSRRPERNQLVSYTLSADRQGRPCAIDATQTGVQPPTAAGHRPFSPPVTGAALFFVLLAAAVVADRIPGWVPVLYLTASLFTYLVYAADKSAARKGAWRTSESTLHLLALAGGWPGALVARQQLRHKSRKQAFRTVFWLTVMLNCAALAWLSTPAGVAALPWAAAGAQGLTGADDRDHGLSGRQAASACRFAERSSTRPVRTSRLTSLPMAAGADDVTVTGT